MKPTFTRQDGACPVTLATDRPGPVLHLWRDGHELASMPLAPSAALRLASDLLRAVTLNHDDERKTP